MRRSSDRGQAEPLAALVAVLAVTAGLTIYAGTLDDSIRDSPDRETVSTTLDNVRRSLQTAGIADPAKLNATTANAPAGRQMNVTLRADGQRWSRGPQPPETAESATTRVSVRLAPTEVRPGRLRVVLWQ